MPDEKRTQFDYLLNAMELAGQHPDPPSQQFSDKRRALFRYVRRLEAAVEPSVAARVRSLEERVATLESQDALAARRWTPGPTRVRST
jgi:hypothetical protein